MKRNTLFLTLTVLFFVFVSVGCKRTVPIQPYGNSGVASYGKLSEAQVRDAIIRGGSNIGWQMSPEGPGMVVGVWKAREHSVTVEIPYSRSSYNIKYRTSVNMLAEGGQIHRNYNRWIERLNRNITAELAKAKR